MSIKRKQARVKEGQDEELEREGWRERDGEKDGCKGNRGFCRLMALLSSCFVGEFTSFWLFAFSVLMPLSPL
jgi:hypothetical protein